MLISDALKRIDYALGEPVGGPQRGALVILNEVGQYVFASYPWRFAKNVRGRATLTEDQEYIRLPLGCARVIAVERVPTWTGSVQLVDAQTFQRVRASALSGDCFFATEDYTLVDGHPVPRLALDHAPTETVTSALSISYEAGWTHLTGEVAAQEVLPVPDFLEPYFAALLEAYAMGAEQGGLSARLAELDSGPLRMAAVERDGRTVIAGGPPQNTAVQMARGYVPPQEFSTINLIT